MVITRPFPFGELMVDQILQNHLIVLNINDRAFIHIKIYEKKIILIVTILPPPSPHPSFPSHTLFLCLTLSQQQTAEICVYM